MNNTTRGSCAVILAAILWSLDGLLRRQLFHLPPSVVVFWEHLFGFILLAPILLVRAKTFPRLSRQQWKAILIVSALSGVAGTVFYTAALGSIHYIPFSVVVLLQQTQPIFAIVSAHAWLREPLQKRFLLIAAFALVSAFFVSFPHLHVYAPADRATALAALLALGAALSWGVSTTLSKYTLNGTSALHVTGIRFGCTAILALLLTLVFKQGAVLPTLDLVDAKTLLLISCSTGLVALAIYYFGLQRVLASRSTILELVWPLSGLFVGSVVLHETLTLTQWVGASGLLIAVVLMSKIQASPSSC